MRSLFCQEWAYQYISRLGSTSADERRTEDSFIAQDTVARVLVLVQEQLEALVFLI